MATVQETLWARIVSYIGGTGTAPTLSMYSAAGVSGVTSQTLAWVNSSILGMTLTGTAATDKSAVEAVATSANKLLTLANGSAVDSAAAALNSADFANLRISVSASDLTLINSALGAQTNAQVANKASVQAIVDAMQDIQATIAGTPSGGLTDADFAAVGLSGVSANNVGMIADALQANGAGKTTVAQLQTIVSDANTSMAKIMGFAASMAATADDETAGNTSFAVPTAADYANVGVTGLSAVQVTLLNSALATQGVINTEADTKGELQGILASAEKIVANLDDVGGTHADPTATDYQQVGLEDISSADHASVLNSYLVNQAIGGSHTNVTASPDITSLTDVRTLLDEAAAVKKILAYAAGANNGLTFADIQELGISTFEKDLTLSLAHLRSQYTADGGYGNMNTVAEIQALLLGQPAHIVKVVSDAPIINGVSTVNVTDTGSFVTFTVTFSKELANAASALSGDNFRLVDNLGSPYSTVDNISSVTLDSSDPSNRTYTVQFWVGQDIDQNQVQIEFVANPNGTGAVKDIENLDTSNHLALADASVSATDTFQQNIDTDMPLVSNVVISGAALTDGVINHAEAGTTASFTVTHAGDAAKVEIYAADGTTLLGTTDWGSNWVVNIDLSTLNPSLNASTGVGSYELVLKEYDDDGNVDQGTYALNFDTLAQNALVTSNVPATVHNTDYTGAAGSEVFTISGSAQEAGTVTVYWDKNNDGVFELTQTATVTAAGGSAWSVNFSKSDLLANAGAGAFKVSFTDAHGNTVSAPQVVSTTIDSGANYSISAGLGPVIAGNDLSLTLYKADGSKLGDATYDATTHSWKYVDVTRYSGVVVAVLNDPNNSVPDYRDESSNSNKDLDSAKTAVLYVDGSTLSTITATVTPLTDITAKKLGVTLTSGQPGDHSTLTQSQVLAADAAVAKLFGISTASQPLFAQTPSFTVDASGNDTSASANVYGLALAVISEAEKTGGLASETLLADLAAKLTVGSDGTVTLAPGANVTTLVNAVNTVLSNTHAPSGVDSALQNAFLGASDNVPPTLQITSNKSALKAGETAIITFTFSEEVVGFTDADITVSGGTLSAITGSGLVRTATFTPSANSASAVASITVAAGSYTDAAQNAGGAGSSPSISIDTLAPVAPVLALGTGVANGATAAEATAATGVVTVSGESGAAITVTFTNGTKTVTKTVTGTGSAQAVALAAGDLTTLGDGTISVQAKQVDTAGNAQTAAASTTSFTLDAQVPSAPTVVLGTGVANGATAAEATAATGVVTVTGEAGAAITVTFVNGTKTVTKTITGTGSAQAVVLASADLTALGDGSISVQAKQVDAAGNPQSAAATTTSFTLDTVVPAAPTLALGTGVANGASLSEATAAGGVVTIAGEAGSLITVTFTNGTKTVTKTVTGTGSAQAVTLASADLTTLGDGTISVQAKQVDAAGNAQSAAAATTSFTLDTVAPAAPTITLGTGIANGATAAEATAATGAITVSGEAGSTINVTFTNGTKTVTKTVTGLGSAQAVTLTASDLSTLGDGTIAVTAAQLDGAGNPQSAAAATTSFTLDTAAPATPTLALGTGVANGATSAEATATTGAVTVLGESGAAITVTFTNGTKTVTKTVTGTGSAQAVTLASADLTTLGDGTISVQAKQVDAAGNAQLAAASTTSFTLDTVVPATPTMALGTGVADGATAAEATAATGVVTVSGESGAAITVTFTNGTKTVTKTVTGTGSAQAVVLAAADLTTLGDGTISVQAKQVDVAGNAQSAAATTTSFTLNTVIPGAPTLALGTGVANGATAAEATAATGAVTVSGQSGAAITVTFTNGTKTVTKTVTGTGSAQAVTLASADLTTLGDGTISVQAKQVDSSGNPQSGAATTTSFTLDTVVPATPTLALGTGVANGASLSEATAATGVVTVSGESGAAITVTFTNGTKTVTKTVTGTGSAQAVTLASADLTTLGDGTISVQAKQVDAAGNAQSAAATTTSFTLDTAAPATPTLALGTGVANGATSAEATATTGAVTVLGESGAAITVTFTNGTKTVTKTVTGTGSAQAVTLASADLTTLGDGTISVSASQVDVAGNTQSAAAATTSFTLDTVVPATPTLALGTGVANGATSAEATATTGAVTVLGESGAAITVTFTNGTKTVTKTVTGTGSAQAVTLASADLTTLGDGTISVQAKQVDAAGNAQSAAAATTSFTLDTVVPATPTLALGTGVANGATSAEATATTGAVTVLGESGAAITVTFTNGTKTVTKTVTGTGSAQAVVLAAADLTALGDGTISVQAKQVDAAGNAQSAAATTTSFTLDTAAPATPTLALGTGVANGATSAEATATTGAVTVLGESGAAITVTFTNGTKTVTKAVTGTGSAQAVTLASADLTTLGDGTISVSASQVDVAGNTQSAAAATTSFTLDTVVPATPTLALGTGVANGATSAEATATTGAVTVLGESGAAITVTFTNGTKTVTKTVTGTGSAQAVTLASADLTTLGDGTISVQAKQVDAAGNAQSAAAATTSFTLDTVVPATPTLALGTGVANGATSAEATATTGAVTVLGESGAAITVTFTNGTKTVTKTVTGTGSAQAVVLAAADLTTLGDGTISVQAKQVDAAGNAQSAAATTTSFTLDTVVPATPTLALGTGVANGASLSEATAATGVVTVSGESGAAITVTFTNGTKTVTKTVTGTGSAQAVVLAAADLTALGDGSISVQAKQVDAAGNAQSAAATTTSFTLDTAAPSAPTFALGTGVAGGATAAEATAATGVVTVSGESGAAISVTFTNGTKTVTKTVTGTGSAQAVTLASADLTTLGDGVITVTASQVDTAGNAQSAAAATTTFTLDRVAPTLDLNQADGTASNNWNVVATATGIQYAIQNSTSASTKALVTDAYNIGKIVIAVNSSVSASTLASETLTIGGTALKLDGSSLPSTVSYAGLTWNVSYASGTFTLTAVGDISSGSAQGLIRTMTYGASTLPSGGNRSLSFTVTDAAGNVGNTAVATVVADGAGPVVDWDGSGTSPFSISRSVTGATTAVDLEGTANIATLTDGSAINSVTLTVSGLVNGGTAERMVVNGTNVAFATSSSTVTISGTTWKWSYAANGSNEGTFVFSNNAGGTVTAAAAQLLMRALSYQQTTSADGVRTFTLSANDQYDNVTATPAVVTMSINGAAPVLAAVGSGVAGTTSVNGVSYTSYGNGQLTTLDVNGDGKLGDSFVVTFSEAVDVSKVTTIANWTLSGSATLGAGATITALDSVTLGGTQYATRYLFKSGTGGNYTSGTTLSISASNVVDTGGAVAAAAQVVTMTDIVAPATPIPPAAIATDNYVNASEKSATTSIAFSHPAATAGDTLNLYVDGVFVKSVATTAGATSTTLTLTGSDWSSDGTHSVTVRMQDAAGNLSGVSASKSVTVDTALSGGFSSLFASTDNGTVNVPNAGDVVKVTFNEKVLITNSSVSTATFGSGATVAAVGAVDGKSDTWLITLGTSPDASMASKSVTFTGVTDIAGNSGSITGSIPSDVFNAPGVPDIRTVTTDNVIDGSEVGSAQAIKIGVDRMVVGDTVKLFMDGVVVGTSTATATDVANGYVSITVAANGWGGDGTRTLSATAQRGATGSVVKSADHAVYVSADSTHWAASGVLWYDPDTLAVGTQVSTWTPSAGVGAATAVNASAGVIEVVAGPDGHNYVKFNVTNGLGSYLAFNSSTVAGATSSTAFQVLQFSVLPGNPYGYSLTYGKPTSGSYNTGTYGYQDWSNNFQVARDQSSIIGVNWDVNVQANLGANSFSLGTAGVYFASFVDTNTVDSVSIGKDGQVLVSNSINSTGIATPSGNGSIGWGGPPWEGTVAGGLQGQSGDVVIASTNLSVAYAGEINTYLVAKYKSAGTWSMPTGVAATYDLSVSAGTASFIDDGLNLTTAQGAGNDKVITAGADYVATGAGNDTVQAKDLDFRSLDGGQGTDTFQLHSLYSGPNTIVLADFVSNARGNSGVTADDNRVNAAGYHKLLGFEAIDLALSKAAQSLTVAAADVNQLSETNKLWVTLGTTNGTTTDTSTDTLTATGFGSTSPTWGYYTYTATDGSTQVYDRKWTGTDGGQTVELYATGGKFDTVTSATVGGTGSNKLATSTNETLTGTASKADTFSWFSGTSGNDTVASFSKTEGDKIDLRGLLSGSGINGSNFGNYLQLTTSGNNVVLKIDTEGSAGFTSPVQQITFTNGFSTGGLNDTLQHLVDQHVVIFA